MFTFEVFCLSFLRCVYLSSHSFSVSFPSLLILMFSPLPFTPLTFYTFLSPPSLYFLCLVLHWWSTALFKSTHQKHSKFCLKSTNILHRAISLSIQETLRRGIRHSVLPCPLLLISILGTYIRHGSKKKLTVMFRKSIAMCFEFLSRTVLLVTTMQVLCKKMTKRKKRKNLSCLVRFYVLRSARGLGSCMHHGGYGLAVQDLPKWSCGCDYSVVYRFYNRHVTRC